MRTPVLSVPQTPSAGSSRPLVSAVIAVYRPHPVYFPAAVRSLLAQTTEDIEVVIVEDPSPVRGDAMLRGIEDPRLRHLVNDTRTSLVSQRNRCLAEARGEFVATLDADDVAEPDRIERQFAFLKANPGVDVVGSQLRVVDPNGQVLGLRAYPTDHASIARAVRRYSPLPHNAVLFRKRAVLDAGGYQYSYNNTVEDYDLWSRLVLRGYRLANLPDALVRYRIHPGQLKATQLRDTIRGVLAVKRKYWVGEMSVGERVQLLAEAALPYLPARLVFAMLIRWRWLSGGRALDRPAAHPRRRPGPHPQPDRPSEVGAGAV